jgi:hypothetical protein
MAFGLWIRRRTSGRAGNAGEEGRLKRNVTVSDEGMVQDAALA